MSARKLFARMYYLGLPVFSTDHDKRTTLITDTFMTVMANSSNAISELGFET